MNEIKVNLFSDQAEVYQLLRPSQQDRRNLSMIVNSTPYRISFLGGGTDYPKWYSDNGGVVLSATIGKYVYTSIKPLPKIFNHRYRVIWNRIEERNELDHIQNPLVREALRLFPRQDYTEIHYQGDLPAQSGLGSSSAFSVGLIDALNAYNKGQKMNLPDLAKLAIKLEREILEESGGIQDQISSAFGGFNKIDIHRNGDFQVSPMSLSNDNMRELEKHCIMFFTGTLRPSATAASSHEINIEHKSKNLHEMMDLTNKAADNLNNNFDLKEFGMQISEGWKLKKDMSNKISNPNIDHIIKIGEKNGAFGSKLLGAGGGGMILFVAPCETHEKIRESLSKLHEIEVKFSHSGSYTEELMNNRLLVSEN